MKTLIRGGLVYDGGGGEGVLADVLVEGDSILDIAPHLCAEDALVIPATGYAVTPGFVDIHRHCDAAALTRADFGELELAQGITTTAIGHCGLAPFPTHEGVRAELYSFLEPVVGSIPTDGSFDSYDRYLAQVSSRGLPLNMGFLAGAGTIKTAVKGFSATPYTPAELTRAADYVREAMDAGALGVSLGIMYPPELYSTPDEMAAVVKPAAQAGGVLCTHIRGEGDGLVSSVQEVIHIAERAGLPLHISHFKATGIRNWRRSIYAAIECIECARARGQDVTADFYPYDGGSSTILSLLPPSLLAHGHQALIQSLDSASGRRRLREEIAREHVGWDNMVLSIGWERIFVCLPEYAGRSVAELADERRQDDPAELVAELLRREGGKTGIIVKSMAQEDIDDIARLPWSFVISDALYGGENPHPRLYGAFPKLIRDFVIDRGVLTLPAAIAKMTAMPADRLGLHDRGRLRPGCKADIAIFDPKRLRDKASYQQPKQLAEGMEYVMVGGQLTWQRQRVWDATLRPGGIIYGHL